MQGLLKIGCSSFQCQYKTTSNLAGRAFYFVTQTSRIQNSGVVHSDVSLEECALL